MSKFTNLIKTTLTPIALCLTLAIAVPAIAKKGHHQKHDGMRQILSELSLTNTQKQDIKQILKQTREDRGLFNTDEKSLRTDLRSLVHSSEWDQAAIESAITQRQALMQEKALQRASNKHQVWNLLTETQQAEFVAQLEFRKTKGEKTRSKGKREHKKLKRLDFTEEQLAAVQAIKTAAKENGAEIKTKLKSYKQAERALIQGANFSPEAWQTLNTGYHADFIAMGIVKAKSKHDIWNLMTPEQQAKAEEKSEKHKRGKKGQRHG
ncbi:Spy/CpxP family protein refolding chaperone [uncultured Paraglaciecola sp.]|uniref:Spy/CpxP family protein refolding chaperone n=1 Tax=uncultured Paraglaciecola sp. TaxID=1765024 RepID=UPI0025DFEE44|nr:Spy/CpxP family protein refolding chaperone [uncultured Paraglaciecola sp.]